MRSEVVPSRVLRSRWWSQWVLVVVMLLSSSGLAVAAPLWQSQATATVVIASLNVRSGPATSYARVAGVKKGDVLTVLGQSGNCAWLKIATPQKQEGWVSGAARYVTLNVKCSAIPAASATAGTAPAPAAATGNQAASGGNAAPTATPAPAAAAPAAAPATASTNLKGLSGRLLYSVANNDAKRWEMWEYNFASGSSSKVADWRTELDISRDGKQIAYFAWPGDAGEKAGIWIMDSNLSNNRMVVPGGIYPVFSPGGDRLAANSFNGDIWVFTTAAEGFRELTRGEYPDWSPVSDEIVHRGCTGGNCGLWVIDANSKDPNAKRRLTTGGGDGQPAWSPDGNRIVYISKDDGNFEIYVINKDGSGKQRLTTEPASDGLPTWSPDGKWIAFRSDRGGTWAIYAMRPDGSDLRKITDANVLEYWFFEKMAWRN